MHGRGATIRNDMKFPAGCDALPTPAVNCDAVSALAFSQAINSLRSFAGMVFLARINCAWLTSKDTGSKLFTFQAGFNSPICKSSNSGAIGRLVSKLSQNSSEAL
jgi:hypothetical protein